jgi:hypothetical protein
MLAVFGIESLEGVCVLVQIIFSLNTGIEKVYAEHRVKLSCSEDTRELKIT